jgi:NAD(P) transhydrogenase
MEKKEFDFVVIGSGPAGQKGAVQASKSGFRVAVMESFEMGGSSLWTGTIPSKALREAILDLTNFLTKSFYANEQKMPDLKEISIGDLNHRVSWVKEHLKETVIQQLKKNKIVMIRGFGKFIDPYTLEIYNDGKVTERIRGKKFLLTSGSKPRMPEKVKGKGKRIFNSTDLLALDVIPESIIVVGGGIIGTEYASMFSILGSKVTIVDKRPRMLSFLDREIGSHLQISLEENNLRFMGNKEYERIEETKDDVGVQFTDGTEVRASTALIAAGRIANVESLGLEKAGLAINPNGYIAVNEHYQTEVTHIFAAGDVIGGPSLSSTSYEQGRLAALNACGFPINRFDQIFPLGIYTIPEISCIGKTEEQLREEKVEYEVGRAYFYEVSKSVITGTESGLCKILFDPGSLELFGVHIIGREATELIHIAQLAISFNAKIDYFVEQVFNFPTFAEMYRIAALNGLNKLKR